MIVLSITQRSEPTMNTAAINIHYIEENQEHNHTQYELAVSRAQKLFLDGWRVVLGLSGKDSGAASVCLVEGLKRAKAIKNDVGPLYLVTTNTTLDNMVLHDFMLTLHDDLEAYGKAFDLPIVCHELRPALSSTPIIEYIGRGKLLRTPETTAKARDCAVSWKIEPMKKFLNEISQKHQTDRICSISGSRDLESTARAKNLKKREETPHTPVKTPLGWTLALIKEWSLSDVWQLFSIIDNGDIESYSDHFNLMKKHYSAGNGGVCDLFAGNLGQNKSCGSRFGCVLCAQTKEDSSLLNQIEIDEKTYGFMRPLNDLRNYMVNTLYDYNHRSSLGRKLTREGYIKVGVNQYSIEYRMDLLRYVLSIQANAFDQYGYHIIDLIDYRELLAIQYHWSREGGEKKPGMALNIWHEIVNEGHRYPVPETQLTPKEFTPEYRYFPLMKFVESNQPVGLDDEGLDNKFKSLARMFKKNGELHRVVRYTESQTFDVVTANAFAMTFVEDFYIELAEDGHLDGKCPTVMLKHLLESGVVTLAKGTIGRVHDDARRAQALNSLRVTLNISLPDAIMMLSVSESQMNLEIASRVQSIHQPSLF
jgi:DNA sulfur modification protein DndC